MVRLRKNQQKSEFFTTLPLSKTQLSHCLGISRSTLFLWERVLLFNLTDFRNDYVLKNQILDLKQPLTPYQCWCLNRFGAIVLVYKTLDRSKVFLKSNENSFSKRIFLKSQPKIGAECYDPGH